MKPAHTSAPAVNASTCNHAQKYLPLRPGQAAFGKSHDARIRKTVRPQRTAPTRRTLFPLSLYVLLVCWRYRRGAACRIAQQLQPSQKGATSTTMLKYARGDVQAPDAKGDRPKKETLAKMSVLNALQRYTERHTWRVGNETSCRRDRQGTRPTVHHNSSTSSAE